MLVDWLAFAAVVTAGAALFAPVATWWASRSRLVTLERVAKVRATVEAGSSAQQDLRELEDRLAAEILTRAKRPAYRSRFVVGGVLTLVGGFTLALHGVISPLVPDDDITIASLTVSAVVYVAAWVTCILGYVFLLWGFNGVLDALVRTIDAWWARIRKGRKTETTTGTPQVATGLPTGDTPAG